MKALIVDDDFTCKLLLQKLLLRYGETAIASTGKEAVDAFSDALMVKEPFDLICLDIMMPGMDGQEVLKLIRALEDAEGRQGENAVKVIMVSSLGDKKNIMEAFKSQCDAYLVKPINAAKLREHLQDFGLLNNLQRGGDGATLEL